MQNTPLGIQNVLLIYFRFSSCACISDVNGKTISGLMALQFHLIWLFWFCSRAFLLTLLWSAEGEIHLPHMGGQRSGSAPEQHQWSCWSQRRSCQQRSEPTPSAWRIITQTCVLFQIHKWKNTPRTHKPTFLSHPLSCQHDFWINLWEGWQIFRTENQHYIVMLPFQES